MSAYRWGNEDLHRVIQGKYRPELVDIATGKVLASYGVPDDPLPVQDYWWVERPAGTWDLPGVRTVGEYVPAADWPVPDPTDVRIYQDNSDAFVPSGEWVAMDPSGRFGVVVPTFADALAFYSRQ